MTALGIIVIIAIVIGLAIVGAYVVKKLKLVDYYKELAKNGKLAEDEKEDETK